MSLQAVFTDANLVEKFNIVCRTFPWAFQQEGKIFEAFHKPHFVLRIPFAGAIVIREAVTGSSLENTKTFIGAVSELCGKDAAAEIGSLVSRKSEIIRALERGGASIFRSIDDFPRDLEDGELVSLSELISEMVVLVAPRGQDFDYIASSD